jgi:RNA polymerase sigma factor (sigma-70 family)
MELLVQRYARLVFATCLRSAPEQRDWAEEGTQAVFILLWRKVGSLQANGQIARWLFRAANLLMKRKLRDEARRRKREVKIMGEIGHSAISPPSRPEWEDALEMLNQALDSLGKKQQDAILLHFLQDRPREEVALHLGCSGKALDNEDPIRFGQTPNLLRQAGPHALSILPYSLAQYSGKGEGAGMSSGRPFLLDRRLGTGRDLRGNVSLGRDRTIGDRRIEDHVA